MASYRYVEGEFLFMLSCHMLHANMLSARRQDKLDLKGNKDSTHGVWLYIAIVLYELWVIDSTYNKAWIRLPENDNSCMSEYHKTCNGWYLEMVVLISSILGLLIYS